MRKEKKKKNKFIHIYVSGLATARLKIYNSRPTRLNNYTTVDYVI